jgi:hypothetical protein
LEIAHLVRPVQPQGNRLHILTFRIAQEPLQVQFKQLPGFFSPEGFVEQRRELGQLRTDLFHICLAQLTVERRVRFP